MKRKIIIFTFLVLGLTFIFNGCKKDDTASIEDSTPQDNGTTVTDIDGNVYHTVTIGTQVWMVENLKTTKYNDGTPITNVTDNGAWGNLSTPAYCWYANDATYKNTYGALYNWFVVDGISNGGKNVCPEGWHVPTDAEWTTLTTYLGGINIAGGKLKEIGLTHWATPNAGATNETGFTALPGSRRYFGGNWGNDIGNNGYWWTATENNTDSWARSMNSSFEYVQRYDYIKRSGFAIRCVKN